MSGGGSLRRIVPDNLDGALYGRRPNGVGTPLLESLSGYLARVCEARSVSVVDALNVFVRPLVPSKLLRSRSHLPRYLHANIASDFDGMTWRAHAAVQALEVLTGNTDLTVHTCLSWRRLFTPRSSGAIRDRGKRWCALCLDAWEREGSEPWEPLLFRLGPVERCPIHGIRLSERCASCHRRQPMIVQRVPLSYCHHCGVRLHIGDPSRERGRFDTDGHGDGGWEWWVSVVLGQMLSVHANSRQLADPNGFASLIDVAVDGFGMNALATAMGFKRNVLRQWRRFIKRPWLRTFVRTCLRLGVHPADVAFPRREGKRTFSWSPWPHGDEPWLMARVRPDRSLPHVRRARIVREAVALDAAIAGGAYDSIADIERIVGVTYDRLIRNFPDQMVKIRAALAANRDERLRRYRRGLQAAIDGQNIVPLPTMSRALGVGLYALRGACPDLCARLVEANAERRRAERNRHRAHLMEVRVERMDRKERERTERREQRKEKVRCAVRTLVAAGERPTFFGALARAGLLGQTGDRAGLHAAWSETLVKCGVSPDAVRPARRGRRSTATR